MLFICHKRKSYQIVLSGTNIGICKKKYKYHVQFFFYIIKILYLGFGFLGHPQNYKYYNITFVIFHSVIIKYSVIRILHIFSLQSCTIFGCPNIAHFSVTKLYKMVLCISACDSHVLIRQQSLYITLHSTVV